MVLYLFMLGWSLFSWIYLDCSLEVLQTLTASLGVCPVAVFKYWCEAVAPEKWSTNYEPTITV
jgi:hypothetical protein